MANHDYIIGGRKEDVLTTKDKSPSLNSAKDWLRHTKVASLFPENRTKILTVNKSTPISDGLKLLVENKILSAPIWDDKGLYTSFIDMVDIVSALLSSGVHIGEGSFAQLIQSSEALKKKTCGAVADLSRRNPFYPVQENAPLMAALDLMVSNRVHRIPVVDASGDLVSIITQSHLAKILSANSSYFPITYERVGTLKLGHKEVISVQSDSRAIDAFETIHNKKVTGIAVLDSSGKLVDNISASDLKLIGADIELLARLFMSVSEFLKLDSRERKILFVTNDNTLGDVLEKLVSTATHRVYVVDDDNKPIGVISLGDVLDVLLKSVKS